MEMSDSALRALVEQVTARVLQSHQPEEVSLNGKILSFADGPAPPVSPETGSAIWWKPGMSVSFHEGQEVEVASLSVTTLAKLVHFIWDTPLLNALGDALLCGATVRVTDPEWKGANPWKKRNGSFGAGVSALVERGRQLGLRFEMEETTKETVVHQKVLTTEDIQEYDRMGIRSIVISPGCIVTPLAAEVAGDRKIALRFA